LHDIDHEGLELYHRELALSEAESRIVYILRGKITALSGKLKGKFRIEAQAVAYDNCWITRR
jgi:hypothetical protein